MRLAQRGRARQVDYLACREQRLYEPRCDPRHDGQMPNRAKGPRLYLKNGDGRPSAWEIRDGSNQVSTECAALDRELAERKLRAYLAAKHKPDREREKDPYSVPVADVLNIYIADRLVSVANAGALKSRVRFLAGFFGRMMLGDINGTVCRAYVESRGSEQAARRELEDLRAAIRHYWREGLCDREIAIVLPPKAQPRERWLTRSEAARLLWAAWRYRQTQGGVTDRSPHAPSRRPVYSRRTLCWHTGRGDLFRFARSCRRSGSRRS